MIRTARSVVRLAAVAAAAVAIAACEVNLNTEGLTAKEKRTFTVSGQPDLTLDTFEGAIEIHSWDKNEVEVEIEKRGMEQALLDEMKIEAEQQGDKVTLKVTGPAKAEHHGLTIGVHISPAARLYVAVPRKSQVNARTGDGSVRVENVQGSLVLRTGDGRVTLDRIAGGIEAHSGDGWLRLEGAGGRLNLETEDGRSPSADGRVCSARAPATVDSDPRRARDADERGVGRRHATGVSPSRCPRSSTPRNRRRDR